MEDTMRHRSWIGKKIEEVAWEPVSVRGSEELSPVSKAAFSGKENKDLEGARTVQGLRMEVKVMLILARSSRKTQKIVLWEMTLVRGIVHKYGHCASPYRKGCMLEF